MERPAALSCAKKALAARGMLEKGNDGRYSKVVKIGGTPTRVYALTSRILDEGER